MQHSAGLLNDPATEASDGQGIQPTDEGGAEASATMLRSNTSTR